MSPGNRAIEQIFEVLREKEREREPDEVPERESDSDYVEHIPADTVPTSMW